MSQTNTEVITTQLKSVLIDIKEQLKNNEGLDDIAFKTLAERAKLVQDKLNQFLKNVGFITDQEIESAYELIQRSKREALEIKQNKAKRNVFIYMGIGIGILVAAYFMTRKK